MGKEFGTTFENMDARFAKLEARNTSLESRITQLHLQRKVDLREIAFNSAKITILQTELAGKDARICKLQSDMELLSEENFDLRDSRFDLAEKIQTLSFQYSNISERYQIFVFMRIFIYFHSILSLRTISLFHACNLVLIFKYHHPV